MAKLKSFCDSLCVGWEEVRIGHHVRMKVTRELSEVSCLVIAQLSKVSFFFPLPLYVSPAKAWAAVAWSTEALLSAQ